MALYELAVTSTKNKELLECFTAGTKNEQSRLIFDECINMLQGSKLFNKFKINKKAIIHKKTDSFLKPLSREDRKSGDGTNPHLLVLDKICQG